MSGISSKAESTLQNNKKYNGKEEQKHEFSDGSGLEWLDYGWRMQDPQIGRWSAIDPKAEKFLNYTPYNYAFNNPFLVVDLDGKEGVVVIGQPGDHRGKDHFLKNGLDRAKKMAAELKMQGSKEGVTILVYKGDNGDASYSEKQMAEFQKQADKAGVGLKIMESNDAIVDYVNEKNGENDSRSNDLVSNFSYIGHATPGSLETGWTGHGLFNSFNKWLDVDKFDKNAFSENSNADLVGGCRTAVPGMFRDAVTTKMARKVGGAVLGSDVTVYYSGGIVDNTHLVKYIGSDGKFVNGNVVKVQGTGGVSKQSAEPKNKE